MGSAVPPGLFSFSIANPQLKLWAIFKCSFGTKGAHSSYYIIRGGVVASDNFHRAFGQGVEKCLAVLFGKNAVVQDHNDAGVGFGADESSDALAKF